jgi:hypothetical protein
MTTAAAFGRQFGEIKFVLAGVENELMPKDEAI